jgi:hypothetical protein
MSGHMMYATAVCFIRLVCFAYAFFTFAGAALFPSAFFS